MKEIDELLDVDALVYDIISNLEFNDYLKYDEDDFDDKDSLRDMVLMRLGYTNYYD